jgi:chemotaxis signal transduction protein
VGLGFESEDIELDEASVLIGFDSDTLVSAPEQRQRATGKGYGKSICTFWIGRDCFGLDVDLVNEVLLVEAIHPIPWAPSALLGLFNSRGQVVPVINLATLLGLASDPTDSHGAQAAQTAILLKADALVAAAVIDRPGLVVQLGTGTFTATDRGSAEPWVQGHLRTRDRSDLLITVLEPARLVQRCLEMARFPDIRTCFGGARPPARLASVKISQGEIS